MILETERLILRKPRSSDWRDVLEACKELDVTKYLSQVPHPYKPKDAKWFVNNTINSWRKKEMKKYTFFIELKSEKKVIGVTDLHGIDTINGTATSGSWMNKKYWKKGYITEAKIVVNEFGFNKLKLRKLKSGAFVFNKGSNIMSKKMGYSHEGTKKKEVICKATGKIHDENITAIFKNEWKIILPKLKKHLTNKIKKLDKK